MKEIYQQTTLSSIPDLPATAVLENALYLMDNLDKAVSIDEEKRHTYMNNPIQYVSTMSLMVCIHGTIDLNIGLQACTMQDNDVLFLKSGVICEVTNMDLDTIFFTLTLDEAFYYPIFSEMDMSILQRALISQPICHMDHRRMEECKAIYKLMKERLLEGANGQLHTDILKGYLQALLFNVYEVYLQQDQQIMYKGKPSRQQELFNRFMELLQKDYRKERNISHYANELCVTPVYLSRVVRAQSGHTASEHIDNFIITEAKQLIRSKQYTILQISEMLNFTCQSFFGRYFKKHTGFSPTAYQQLSLF
jgi:AraC-like DNA-binding protein